jgi:hypothetical protein
MIEILLGIVIAAICGFVFVAAFSSTSTGSAKTAPAEAKPKPKVEKKPKVTKKEAAAKAKEEAEIERLVQAQGVSVSGMPTDKQRVVSLEETQAKRAKKEGSPVAASSKAGNRSTIESTKQRIVDEQQGFTVVEKKTKSSSPVAAVTEEKGGRDIDRELSRFFKQQDKKSKDKKSEYQTKKDDNAKVTGRVSMSQKFTSNPTDLWAQGRKWE